MASKGLLDTCQDIVDSEKCQDIADTLLPGGSMAEAKVLDRERAIQRFLNGGRPATICRALGYSREWFYKWLARYQSGDVEWAHEQARRPHRSPTRVTPRIESAVVTTRHTLRQRQLFAGAQAIAWEL